MTQLGVHAEVDDGNSAPRDSLPKNRVSLISKPSGKTVEKYLLVVLTAALIIFFSILPASASNFATIANWRNLGATDSVIAVLALSTTVTLLAGQFDFSIGMNLELSGIAAAKLMASGGSWYEAMLVALAVGAGIGLVNGTIVSRFGINPFIATLGMSTILTGIEELWISGQTITINSGPLTNFAGTTSDWLGIPKIVYVALAVALLIWYVTAWTPLGRYFFAVGTNREAARFVGIRVQRTVFLSFLLGGAIAGFAGFMQLARTSAGVPGVGSTLMLAAIAATLLGATTIRVGRPNVWGTMVAVVFVAVGTQGLILAGAAPWVTYVFEGVSLIVGVSLSTAAARSGRGRKSRDLQSGDAFI